METIINIAFYAIVIWLCCSAFAAWTYPKRRIEPEPEGEYEGQVPRRSFRQ